MRKGKDIIQIASYLWGFPILIEPIKTNQRQVVLSKNQLFINNSIGGSCCESANGVRRKVWNIKHLLSFKYLKCSHLFANTCKSYVFCRNFCNAWINNFFRCKLTNARLDDERLALVRSPKACLPLPEQFLLFSVLCEKCISHQIRIFLTLEDFFLFIFAIVHLEKSWGCWLRVRVGNMIQITKTSQNVKIYSLK